MRQIDLGSETRRDRRVHFQRKRSRVHRTWNLRVQPDRKGASNGKKYTCQRFFVFNFVCLQIEVALLDVPVSDNSRSGNDHPDNANGTSVIVLQPR